MLDLIIVVTLLSLGPVSACLGDRLWMGKPSLCRTRHPGLLSPPSVAGWNEYPAKAGRVNRHIAWYTSPYPWPRSVVLVPGWTDWLAEISTNLREAVTHLRRVCNSALYISTVTLLSPKNTLLHIHYSVITGTGSSDCCCAYNLLVGCKPSCSCCPKSAPCCIFVPNCVQIYYLVPRLY